MRHLVERALYRFQSAQQSYDGLAARHFIFLKYLLSELLFGHDFAGAAAVLSVLYHDFPRDPVLMLRVGGGMPKTGK